METSRRLFGFICQSTTEWNRIFSFPALFIISTKLVTASCGLYAFIQGLIMPNDYLSTMRWLMLSVSLLDLILMVIIFTAADMPINEVMKTLQT